MKDITMVFMTFEVKNTLYFQILFHCFIIGRRYIIHSKDYTYLIMRRQSKQQQGSDSDEASVLGESEEELLPQVDDFDDASSI